MLCTGIWVPIITPLQDGALDGDALQRLTDRLIQDGVRGLIVGGTTGEPATLSKTELELAYRAVCEASAGRVPVGLGLAGMDSTALAATARAWAKWEPALYLVPPPYYVRPSQDGMLAHFRLLAKASPIPIMLYNIPYRTGVNLLPETIRRLADLRTVQAIKESGAGNLPQLEALLQDGRLAVMSGEDALIFVLGCLGGQGAVAAAAHVRTDLFVRLWSCLERGELQQARALHRHLAPLIAALFSEPNPSPVKAALALTGEIEPGLRLPLLPASLECVARLRDCLDRLEEQYPRVWSGSMACEEAVR